MEIPSELFKVFAPLGERLNEFEMNGYPTPLTKGKYEALIFNIGKGINEFDPKAVWDVAVSYYERASTLHKKVNRESLKNTSLEKSKPEIYYYSSKLAEIIETKADFLNKFRKKTLATDAPKVTITPIELPKGFTVTQIKKHFEPSLTITQAALLLHYFKDKGILPPYSDQSIGKLAEAFFARNQKNITTNLTTIHSLKAKRGELESLKKVLQSLIIGIDSDIKKAH